jgi:hypothetical protein
MVMRLGVWLALAALPLGALGQDGKPAAKDTRPKRAEELIAADGLRKHVEFLASDELKGRMAGEPENDRATEYIAKHFEKLGLKPLGTDGFYQPFNFKRSKIDTKTRNVVALLEGGSLKDEFVVFGAHCDHVGTSSMPNPGRSRAGDDKIYNGADDNASGTAVLLELARAFAQGGAKPKRSIIFIAFNAEEWGLLGSAHYVANPPKPLEKHVAAICCDMVGRNQDKPITIKGAGSAAEWPDLIKKMNEGVELKYNLVLPASGSTDYLNYIKKKIPSIDYYSEDHPDYHGPGDHAEKLGYDRMEKIGRHAFKITLEVANREGRMAFTQPPKAQK